MSYGATVFPHGFVWKVSSVISGNGFLWFLYLQQTNIENTLQGTNISHLGKRNIIFNMPFLGDMLVPWRVTLKLNLK